MTKEYQLKKNPLTTNRFFKIAKEMLEESKLDRAKAMETYDYFKTLADSETERDIDTAQKCMVDCLKLAQDSRNKALKALELLLKLTKDTKTKEKDTENLSFNDMT